MGWPIKYSIGNLCNELSNRIARKAGHKDHTWLNGNTKTRSTKTADITLNQFCVLRSWEFAGKGRAARPSQSTRISFRAGRIRRSCRVTIHLSSSIRQRWWCCCHCIKTFGDTYLHSTDEDSFVKGHLWGHLGVTQLTLQGALESSGFHSNRDHVII